jgi:large subunit ribosomal protein L1
LWISKINGCRGKRLLKKKSKRFKELLKNSKDFKSKDLKDILELIKKNSTVKFDESIDVSLRIGLKQSKGGDFNLRTVTQLPAGTGKKTKIAVLCETDKIEEAKKSGADIVGSDDLIEKIAAGKFNFDKLICTPSMMGKVGKHGKILGPKGLMPNPKLGTVSTNIKKSVNDIKTGLVEIKHDKDGNIGLSIGRKSFSTENLASNFKHFVDFVKKEKPDAIKGDFIKNIFITSSMGTSVKVSNKGI